ncbi:MAG: hypothetical protein II937_13885 [Bacteroidales bacterium]|nr:hypothetical protein [Bacteroidales bacterium]
MAGEIQVKNINQFVAECSEIGDLHGSYLYGIDTQGNSIKVNIEEIADLDRPEIPEMDWYDIDSGEGSGVIYGGGSSSGGASSEEVEKIKERLIQLGVDLEEVRALVAAKADKEHTHVKDDITDLADEISNLHEIDTQLSNRITSAATNIENLTGKVSNVQNDISHLVENIESIENQLDGKADKVHTHAISDIDGLTKELQTVAQNTTRIQTLETADTEIKRSIEQVKSDIEKIENTAGLKQVADIDNYKGKAGEIVQYIGLTNEKYTNGYIYQCELTDIAIPLSTEYIQVLKDDFKNIPQGDYIKIGQTDEDITVEIEEYSNVSGDGNIYHSSPYSLLEIGDCIWDNNGNLYEVTEKSETGRLVLSNGAILFKNTSTAVSSKADVFFNYQTGTKIYRVQTIPIYIGILRGTNLYIEGCGYKFADSCAERHVDSQGMTVETYEWLLKCVQPDFREWFKWNIIE